MFFKKHKKKIISIISVVALMTIAVIAGYRMANVDGNTQPENEQIADTIQAEELLPAAVEDGRVNKDAKIIFDYHYEICGHVIREETTATQEMAGLTLKQFEEKFPSAKITEFSPSLVKLSIKFNQYCPEHLVLRQHDDSIAIFKTEKGTDVMQLYMRLAVSFDTLDSNEQKVLIEGKMFNTLEEIEEYLEDIES